MTGTESSPEFIRDRWCVAFSDLAVLKSNLGDVVPDFDKFIKNCVDNNLIKKSNMEVDTGAVLSYYSQGLGTFERTKFYEGKTDSLPMTVEERDRRYQSLGDDLLKHNLTAVTLRVHDGHTISLHRNPPDVNGKVTYSVVDTGNSKMNGSIFDPENPLSDSELSEKLIRAIDAGRVTEGSVVQVSIDTNGDGIHNHFTLGRVYINNGQPSIMINDHSSSIRQNVDWLDLNHGSAEKGKGLNILRLFTTDVKAK
ncbi:hypothetical protein [Leptospira bandrabouensis]|uniref:Uncharacterized protein n=1 Tax=Leptospira bandrabouensis TaxID=2484903 RepID=A0A6H3NXX1_9LEPT|nr:hypothetical protein [Leptospira bandrabouensis]MCG6150474.1 hypothetical protein [Leptospira bandrabouensis]TGN05682.1 hypothetical protein EHR07_14065 [Leptospira bandrabouensis]TGN16013.1 hypothetical protein EHR08_06980 [Leptospira bandrabouensis]